MSYGPLTKETIGKLSSGQAFQVAGEWNPDDFTLPFAERLAENISDYYDFPVEGKDQSAAVVSLINRLAKQQNVELARTTLNGWMKGDRDPSVSSSDQQTRENIYKLCAVLDYDYYQTTEMFSKVFFTRAFNPKNKKELALRFYAQRDYKAGVEGSSWYRKGEKAINSLIQSDSITYFEQLVTDTGLIIEETELMDEAEFLDFLVSNPETFTRKNENTAARNEVKRAAMEACRVIPEIGSVSSPKDIPYETLIGIILGYTQRNSTMAVGAVSSLKSLPAQLTTNFPTGQILRKICLDEECTYDQIYKMLCLMLFFLYFVKGPEGISVEQSFKEYLRLSNMQLDKVGFAELYPRQPYGGLLLFCAAHENPLSELRSFLKKKVDEESDAVLQEEMKKAFPDMKNSTCLDVVHAAQRNPYLIRLIIGTLRRENSTAEISGILNYAAEEDGLLQYLYENAGFTEKEKESLRYLTLFPPAGLSDNLMSSILKDEEKMAVYQLEKDNWVNFEKTGWSLDYRIRKLVNDQIDFPNKKNCKTFIDSLSAVDPGDFSEKECKQLEKLRKRIKNL